MPDPAIAFEGGNCGEIFDKATRDKVGSVGGWNSWPNQHRDRLPGKWRWSACYRGAASRGDEVRVEYTGDDEPQEAKVRLREMLCAVLGKREVAK